LLATLSGFAERQKIFEQAGSPDFWQENPSRGT